MIEPTQSTPEVVLHVGMQQSGATMLQRALSRLRPRLRAAGVTYLGHGEICQLEHRAGWQRVADADRTLAADFARDLRAAVDRERRAVSADTERPVVLISSDHLLGSRNIDFGDAPVFRPQAGSALGQVIDALGVDRVEVVLFTHRQDRLMELCYLREVQKGEHHSFDSQFPYRFDPVLDYVELIERIRALPGVSQVTVKPFELIGAGPVAFVDEFLAVLGLRGAVNGGTVGSGLFPHRVYSRLGLKLAQAMNPHTETPKERGLVREFLLENFAAEDEHSSRFLPKRVRHRILETYQEQNRCLFATWMPDFPVDGYASNEATEALGGVHRSGGRTGDAVGASAPAGGSRA